MHKYGRWCLRYKNQNKRCPWFQDKEARLPELKQLLKCLKMSLLVCKNIINVHVIGAGLKSPSEEISGEYHLVKCINAGVFNWGLENTTEVSVNVPCSGLISELMEPWENLKPEENLASLTQKDRKERENSQI